MPPTPQVSEVSLVLGLFLSLALTLYRCNATAIHLFPLGLLDSHHADAASFLCISFFLLTDCTTRFHCSTSDFSEPEDLGQL